MRNFRMAAWSLPLFAALMLSTPSCTDKEKLKESQQENSELTTRLQETIQTQDSLFALINDITRGMTQIKEMERIVSTPGSLEGETPSRKEQLRNDMISLQQALQERRERLDELEQKLKSASGQNATLLTTIKNLKAQVAEQQTEIITLTNQLAEANIKITNLGSQVDSLITETVNVREELDAANRETENVTNELNTVYYVIGSKKELKEHDIIDTGFLRKTKVLQSDIDLNYFTSADRRQLTVIPLHSNKAKVMTSQPEGSYVIADDGSGQKVLRIVNPEKFWLRSNLLVIEID